MTPDEHQVVLRAESLIQSGRMSDALKALAILITAFSQKLTVTCDWKNGKLDITTLPAKSDGFPVKGLPIDEQVDVLLSDWLHATRSVPGREKMYDWVNTYGEETVREVVYMMLAKHSEKKMDRRYQENYVGYVLRGRERLRPLSPEEQLKDDLAYADFDMGVKAQVIAEQSGELLEI